MSIAPTTPDSASMEPTERSMPADEMTNVMPIASTPNTDVESRMLRMLETDRKALDKIAIAREHGEHDQRFEADGGAAGEARAPRRCRRGGEVEVIERSSNEAAPPAEGARRAAPVRLT